MADIGKKAKFDRDGFTTIVTSILFISLFYNSYRYPLMINYTGTSPTYSDTPPYLQITKYVIFVSLFVLMFLKRLLAGNLPVVHKPTVFCLYAGLFVPPLFYALVVRNSYLFSLSFFFLIPIMLHLFYRDCALDLSRLANAISRCLVIFILVNAVQVVLFIAIGRLPALAYEGSLSVRFGSVLDDPNSFGILLSLFIGFAVFNYSGYFRSAILICLCICLVLTQSLTAMIFVPLSVLIVSAITIKANYRLLIGLLLILGGFIGILLYNIELLQPLILQKQSSAADHGSALKLVSDSNFITYLGLDPIEMTSESGYINMLTTMGIAYVAGFLCLGLVSIWELISLLYSSRNNLSRSILFGALCFLITFYLSCINLPFEKVFPVNALAYLLIGIVTTGALRRGIGNQ